MNIEDLKHQPEWLEGWHGLSRYLIDARDRNEEIAETEWFCDDCGELVDETEYTHCPDCRG